MEENPENAREKNRCDTEMLADGAQNAFDTTNRKFDISIYSSIETFDTTSNTNECVSYAASKLSIPYPTLTNA